MFPVLSEERSWGTKKEENIESILKELPVSQDEVIPLGNNNDNLFHNYDLI